jgi:hypothetical protein
MTLHTIITCTVYTYRHNYQRMYTPRMYKRLRMDDSVEAVFSADGTSGFRNNSDFDVDSATNESRVDTSDSDTLVTIVNMLQREYV